jgi:hypothetical protein
MTHVGKILVVVIMVFSIIFFALATVVFTTEVNWKKQVTDLNDTKKKLEDQKSTLKRQLGDQETNLKVAQDAAKKAEDGFRKEIKDLTDTNNRRQEEITKQRTSVETALQEVKKAQDEAEARISESNVLRQNLQTVQNQRDEFLLARTELQQKIVILNRELAVAQENNKNLRDRVALLDSVIRKAGLNADTADLKVLRNPPHVEGEVTRVDAKGTTMEISIGKDDGLVEGLELVVYRSKPTPEYLGKVRVVSVDPDQASVKVIGTTYHGKKIKEGDSVATQVRPRS